MTVNAERLLHLVNDFIKYLKIERQLSLHTCNAYLTDIKQFLTYLGHLDLVPKQLTLYNSYISQQGLSAKTIARKQSSLLTFSKFLLAENIIDWKPESYLIKPKTSQTLPKYFSQEDMVKLIDFASQTLQYPNRNRAIIELMYACGLRISEIIDVKASCLSINYDQLKVSGKGKKDRLLPIGKEAQVSLQNYLNSDYIELNKLGHDNLFLSNRGKSFSRSGLYVMIKNMIINSGLDSNLSPHSIRHAFATHLLEGDASLREVQELLGHENIMTTQIYTKVSTKKCRAVYDKTHPRATL